MAEATIFLLRSGTVVDVEEPRMIGQDPRYQKQVGRFTIEIERANKGKIYFDYLTFDCKGTVMSQYPRQGDDVDVEFTLGGTKYVKDGVTKYFTKLNALNVATKYNQQPAPSQNRAPAPPPSYGMPPATPATPSSFQGPISNVNDLEDLPF